VKTTSGGIVIVNDDVSESDRFAVGVGDDGAVVGARRGGLVRFDGETRALGGPSDADPRQPTIRAVAMAKSAGVVAASVQDAGIYRFGRSAPEAIVTTLTRADDLRMVSIENHAHGAGGLAVLARDDRGLWFLAQQHGDSWTVPLREGDPSIAGCRPSAPPAVGGEDIWLLLDCFPTEGDSYDMVVHLRPNEPPRRVIATEAVGAIHTIEGSVTAVFAGRSDVAVAINSGTQLARLDGEDAISFAPLRPGDDVLADHPQAVQLRSHELRFLLGGYEIGLVSWGQRRSRIRALAHGVTLGTRGGSSHHATDGKNIFNGSGIDDFGDAESALYRLRFGEPTLLAKTDEDVAPGVRIGHVSEYVVMKRQIALMTTLRAPASAVAAVAVVPAR